MKFWISDGYPLWIIVEDDEDPPEPTFSAEEFSVRENEGPAEVTVEIPSALSINLTVGLTTTRNTACGGEDEHTFTDHLGNMKTVVCHDATDTNNPNNGVDPDIPGSVDYTKLEDHTVTIAAGSTTATAQITIINDKRIEGGSSNSYEDFTVQITSVDGTSVTDGATAEVNIIDEDRIIAAKSGSYAVNERDGSLKVILHSIRAWPVDKVVSLRTDDVNTDGTEYSVPAQVTLPADKEEVEFTIAIYYGRVTTNSLFRVTVDLGEDLPYGENNPYFDVTILWDNPAALDACNLPKEVSEAEIGLQEGACAIPAGSNVNDVSETTALGVTYSVKGDTPAACSDTTHTTETACTGAGGTWTPGTDGVLRWSGYAEDDNIVSHRLIGEGGTPLLKLVNGDMSQIYATHQGGEWTFKLGRRIQSGDDYRLVGTPVGSGWSRSTCSPSSSSASDSPNLVAVRGSDRVFHLTAPFGGRHKYSCHLYQLPGYSGGNSPWRTFDFAIERIVPGDPPVKVTENHSIPQDQLRFVILGTGWAAVESRGVTDSRFEGKTSRLESLGGYNHQLTVVSSDAVSPWDALVSSESLLDKSYRDLRSSW